MLFVNVLPTLLNLVEEALKTDEDKGRQALQSMDELTQSHPEVWKNLTKDLIEVVTKVASFKDFEEGTRASAVELGLSLANEMPSALRKNQDSTKAFVETLVNMLLEVEDDESVWAEQIEDPDKLSTDPVSTASTAIVRLSDKIGEKTTLAVCQPMIMEYVKQDTWPHRFAGYTLFGLITQTCADSYAKNLEMAMQTASAGVKDTDTRVRFAAFGALQALLTYLAPAA